MLEKLCLRWNEFKENAITAFGSLRDDQDFSDVTLACEDGQQVEAHKVILAASSPFFQKLLGRNKHPHPLIYMRGMKSEDLLAVMDFLYHGEANVFQENLDSFMAVAEELQLKGLMGKPEESVQHFEGDEKSLPKIFSPDTNTNTKSYFKRQTPDIHNPREDCSLAIPNSFSGDLEELEERVKSLMEKSQNHYLGRQGFAQRCKVCGKEGQRMNIKDHIEANHIEGIIIPCNLCDKTFKSRHRLTLHKRQHQS